MIEAVLYDLDGLLVNSEPLHILASEKALNAYGHSLEELPAQMRKDFFGKKVIDVASGIIEFLGLDVSPGRWTDERTEIFLGLIQDGVPLMPGVRESVGLFENLGLKLAVVSSGVREYVGRVLDLTGMTCHFHAVITGSDVTRGKPDPQCFLLAARSISVDPPACLVLEDAYAGVRAAKAAGMKVIGVKNLFNDRFEGADLVVGSLAGIDKRTLEVLSNSGPRGQR